MKNEGTMLSVALKKVVFGRKNQISSLVFVIFVPKSNIYTSSLKT